MTKADFRCNNRSTRRANLLRIMRPKRIAFIGGQQIVGPINVCRRAGFNGEIVVVNPQRDEIAGIPCVSSISALDMPPDAALLALSPMRTIDAVRELNAIGAAGAVAIAAGFSELGAEGRALQDALRSAAGNMAVMGPNCMGLLNQFDGAAIWAEDNHIERVDGEGCAIVSQSGAFLFGITNVEQVFPLGYGMSVGNQAVVDIADCISALLTDDRVRAIGLYLEGIDDGVALAEACEQALVSRVPIIAIKGGDTTEGEKVALSHTAAMLVERDLWEAFRDRYGIIEVKTPKAMVETLKYLSIAGLPAGNRITAVSFSGGLNGLVAAQAGGIGLSLPQPAGDNAQELRALMPDTVPVSNPLDLNLPFRSSTGMSLEDGPSIGRGITLLARDVSDQVLFFLDVPRSDEKGLDTAWLPSVEAMFDVAENLGLPCAVCGIMPEGLEPALRRRLMEGGVAPLMGFGDALTAVGTAVAAGEGMRRIKIAPPLPLSLPDIRTVPRHMLDEAASKTALSEFGLKVPNFRTASVKDVGSVATELGFPVAIKVLGTQIAHKYAVGGVRLNVSSKEAAEKAVFDMISAVHDAVSGYRAERFLLEPMVDGAIGEYIIGIKRHPALGLALMIGLGGTSVERQATYRSVLLPMASGELDGALAQLGVSPRSVYHRALSEAVDAVASYAITHSDRLLTLDVNPVVVTAQGNAVAVDALIVLSGEEGK